MRRVLQVSALHALRGCCHHILGQQHCPAACNAQPPGPKSASREHSSHRNVASSVGACVGWAACLARELAHHVACHYTCRPGAARRLHALQPANQARAVYRCAWGTEVPPWCAGRGEVPLMWFHRPQRALLQPCRTGAVAQGTQSGCQRMLTGRLAGGRRGQWRLAVKACLRNCSVPARTHVAAQLRAGQRHSSCCARGRWAGGPNEGAAHYRLLLKHAAAQGVCPGRSPPGEKWRTGFASRPQEVCTTEGRLYYAVVKCTRSLPFCLSVCLSTCLHVHAPAGSCPAACLAAEAARQLRARGLASARQDAAERRGVDVAKLVDRRHAAHVHAAHHLARVPEWAAALALAVRLGGAWRRGEEQW